MAHVAAQLLLLLLLQLLPSVAFAANSCLAIFVMSINRALIICHDKSHVYGRMVLSSVRQQRGYRLRFQERNI